MGLSISKTYSGIVATGVQPRIPAPGGAPFATYGVEVKGVAVAATSWTVVLEGSLDAVTWTTLLTHNSTDGSTAWDTTGRPCLFVRPNVTALTLGSASSITVNVVANP